MLSRRYGQLSFFATVGAAGGGGGRLYKSNERDGPVVGLCRIHSSPRLQLLDLVEYVVLMLLTAARAIPSNTRPNGAAVRECIEHGIAQSRSQ